MPDNRIICRLLTDVYISLRSPLFLEIKVTDVVDDPQISAKMTKKDVQLNSLEALKVFDLMENNSAIPMSVLK